MNILNIKSAPGQETQSQAAAKDPVQLSRCLQQAMLQLKADHMSPDGRGVDYAGIASGKAFADYLSLAEELIECDPTSLSEEERMAFFINIYNCLTIHGLASAEKLPSSVLELHEFWKLTCYSIKGLTFSLDDIEHGVLRGNRPHPSADTPPFGETDPRKEMSLKKCDPRIHFTLVCGAMSCPAIQVYSAKNLERALGQAAASFCSQEVGVDILARKVALSKIFLWYGSDFGSNEKELLQALSQYVAGETKEALMQLLSNTEPIEIDFKQYNWKLNKL